MEKNSGAKEVLMIDHDEVVLPGFRFHPTDEELIGFYLRRKVSKKSFSIKIIKEIDIYKYDPWDLPKSIAAGEREWYFFCLRGRKYRNSIRPNRVTGSGFWKATGIDRPIFSAGGAGDCLGLKKSLVYYIGSAGKGTKTDWMMHEFRLPANSKDSADTISPSMQEAEIWTICRIFKRNVTYKRHSQHWKEPPVKQIPADSSSKTSSLESDSQNEYTHFVSSSHPREELGFANNYFEESDQLHAAPWGAAGQANSLQQQDIAATPNMELFGDGNWDELARIMEFMTEQTTVAYDCIYT